MRRVLGSKRAFSAAAALLISVAMVQSAGALLAGTDDTSISMEVAEQLADGLSGAGPVVKVPGAHAANLTHPESVNEALRSFLVSLPP